MTLRLLTMLALILADGAEAAEAERYPAARVVGWSVTLYWRDYAAAGRGHQRLSGYVETREQCEAIKAATVAAIKGGKLRCDFTNELMVVRP